MEYQVIGLATTVAILVITLFFVICFFKRKINQNKNLGSSEHNPKYLELVNNSIEESEILIPNKKKFDTRNHSMTP